MTDPSFGAPPPSAAAGDGPSGPRASFGVRFLAALIDGILVGVVGGIVRAILGLDLAGAQGVQLLLGLGYYGYLEGSPSGQTVGKKVMSIRVIDFAGGGAIGPGRAVIRFVARYLSGIVCLLGYFWMLWDKEKQTWHDKLSNSVVVPTSAYPVDAWPG
jgi:uncharacterized RDD family membrane protein YckC